MGILYIYIYIYKTIIHIIIVDKKPLIPFNTSKYCINIYGILII